MDEGLEISSVGPPFWSGLKHLNCYCFPFCINSKNMHVQMSVQNKKEEKKSNPLQIKTV